MKQVFVTDLTLRYFNGTFKDVTEIAKLLDRSGVSTIVTMPIKEKEKDSLLLRTLSQVVVDATLCVPVEADKLTEENIALAIDAVKSAKKHTICFEIPTSAVQMEYMAHAKPKVLHERLISAINFAKERTSVYVSLLDATRTDFDFIKEVVDICLEHGVDGINFYDEVSYLSYLSANKCAETVIMLKDNCKVPDNVALFLCSSDVLSLGLAISLIALDNGLDGICTSFFTPKAPSLFAFAKYVKTSKNFDTNLRLTEITQISTKIKQITDRYDAKISRKPRPHIALEANLRDPASQHISLGKSVTINELQEVTERLGYNLSDASLVSVYEVFSQLAKKKPVTVTELEAIIATSSTQATPVYVLDSFIITSGDKIATTATVHVKFEGQVRTGLAIGDGPIAAVFNALEQVVGKHYELDDFQIASVTEGREALGRTLVKLRNNGRIYSGLGLSANIIESSILAYISALNKIYSEKK